jgi:imidazolonepropionase-like amidohydrolase
LHDRGTLEPGKRADLVALGGDPLRDLGAVRDVIAVFVAGHRVSSW